jgi:DNA modification methylase
LNSRLLVGDCREQLASIPNDSIDAIVTDPPYELGFMGKAWDASGIAYNVEVWRECLRVLKPGGHLLAFSGSRTYHRMTCAIEDAGFEIRDQIMWVYGSGFPKSHDVSKAIDKAAGVEREVVGVNAYASRRPNNGTSETGYGESLGGPSTTIITAPATEAAQQWQGWGTALKPAHEPICMARKPLIGTVAENVLAHGTGAINVDGCRVGTEERTNGGMSSLGVMHDDDWKPREVSSKVTGRWPANLIHDGGDEVVGLFPVTTSHGGGKATYGGTFGNGAEVTDKTAMQRFAGDTGSAARFFYCAKASKRDRDEGCEGMEAKLPVDGADKWTEQDRRRGEGVTRQPSKNHHPTVKPTDLMRYLCRLVTPPGGTVLDPFTGSGSTGKAAMLEGFDFIGIEMSPEYVEIAQARINFAKGIF